jgi:uncharacterized membrane protein YfcA
MLSDLSLYLLLLLAGAFFAAFVTGAVGFADAMILNAVWLHIMDPLAAVPLVVSCGVLMHMLPIFRLRKTLDFSRLLPFVAGGVLGVPMGVWVLGYIEPDIFRTVIGALMVVYGFWMFLHPHSSVGEVGGRPLDSLVGLGGGIMGGFAGLSGLFPIIWTSMRSWPKHLQRGSCQLFVFIMHGIGVVTFVSAGKFTQQTGTDLIWCIPMLIIGSWLGLKIYPHLNDRLFKHIIIGLNLIAGITLLL